jgi:hypothetical protein
MTRIQFKPVLIFLFVIGATTLFGTLKTSQGQEPPRFEYVLEGTLDNDTGIIWGFGLRESFGTVASWDFARSVASDVYPAFSEDYVNQTYGVPGVYHEDWRLPTRAELADAVNAGLFLFHGLDPAVPFDSAIDQSNPSTIGRYTSDAKGNRCYTVNLWTGEVLLIGKNSAINAIFVRGGNPDSGSGGGGKGKGNRNK